MLIFIGGNNMSVYKDENKGTWYVKYTIEDLPTGTKNVRPIVDLKLQKLQKSGNIKLALKLNLGQAKLSKSWLLNGKLTTSLAKKLLDTITNASNSDCTTLRKRE